MIRMAVRVGPGEGKLDAGDSAGSGTMGIGVIGAGDTGGAPTPPGHDVSAAGSPDESWRHRPGPPGYGADATPDALPEPLADASPERTAESTA
jgi:hypothetical protein